MSKIKRLLVLAVMCGGSVGGAALSAPVANGQASYWYCWQWVLKSGAVCRDPNYRNGIIGNYGRAYNYSYPVCVDDQYNSGGWKNYFPWICAPAGQYAFADGGVNVGIYNGYAVVKNNSSGTTWSYDGSVTYTG